MGKVRDASDRCNGGADLVQIAERFENEQIDAAGDERLRLLAEKRLSLVGAHLAPRLDANAQRTDRTRDVGLRRAPLCAQAGRPPR